jgi:LacI family transcriptional regulator, galactose operon repressor
MDGDPRPTDGAVSGDGDRVVTLKDVARAADVHVSTASRALDPARSDRIGSDTVARVAHAAERLGYRPDLIAKGLKSGTTTMIGVVVADLENPFIGPIIRGISEQMESVGFVTLVAETLEDRARFERVLNQLLSHRVNAVITTAARSSDQHLLVRFARRTRAFITAVRRVEGSGLPYVVMDDDRGGELAATHLIELGHRVLAQLRGPSDIDAFANRAEGFRRTIGAARAVDATPGGHARELTVEEGRRLMAQALDENPESPPTAVFAHADLMAIGGLEEIRSRGLRCPEDVSVVGYDDAPLVNHISPSLSTIALPGEEIGARAGEMVLEMLAEPTARPESIRLPAELITRDSSGRPPSH